ncbi:hypothetical protein E8K88_17520 [Lampropedia aestuarii]|uniref:Uncharacterized protein n=1 Tax=Lampropedia aestuarii TaxID=2562762 RepID=A0A4S5BFB0_9BURK|nr:hypothetical protein [Lampropedia aestuarii]MDH5858158.1 hypothetical protein [Lampropedia aestuarii]THJ30679.1 hypothetical protein E8K88_17520 [Lampropedia aestuarii]
MTVLLADAWAHCLAMLSPGPDRVRVAVVFLWDALIVLLLSQGALRRGCNRSVFYIDQFTGLILGAIGVKIVHGAVSHS